MLSTSFPCNRQRKPGSASLYYRGIVNQVRTTGRRRERLAGGAVIEALAGSNPSIGRSLARYQGTGRIQLEKIRQAARIKALAEANARSKQRYGEIGATPENAGAFKPAPRVRPQAVVPPPKPPVATNPFASGTLGQGTAEKMDNDALAGAMKEPFDEKPKPAAGAAPAAAGGGDPFGGGGAAGGGADPFGGGGAAGGGADPFGGGGAAGGGADPFGGGGAAGGGADPFGGGGAAGGGADPFGGSNPFGN